MSAAQTFKVWDRVIHLKLGRSGTVTYIYTQTIENAPETGVQVYRVQFDNFSSTVDTYEWELERESK